MTDSKKEEYILKLEKQLAWHQKKLDEVNQLYYTESRFLKLHRYLSYQLKKRGLLGLMLFILKRKVFKQ